MTSVCADLMQRDRVLDSGEGGDLMYDSFSDVGEIRVYFASKILTPCRMH